jgi:glyoxylase-like metal-dependent hydrolase (beta-lactamase superfamily II)
MRMTHFASVFCSLFLTFATPIYGQKTPNFLKKCWQLQSKNLQKNYLNVQFSEQSKELGHDFYPWKETVYAGNGQIWFNNTHFLKSDTIKTGARTYFSKIQFDEQNLLFLDYGDETLFEVTDQMFWDQIHKTARYSPAILLDYFWSNRIKNTVKMVENYAVYAQKIQNRPVEIWINQQTYLIQKVRVTSADDLLGDVVTNYNYSDFEKLGKLSFPRTILIDRIDGRINESVKITAFSTPKTVKNLLEKPENYQMKSAQPLVPDIFVEHYSPNIHVLNLKHTDDRTLLVEFKDFFVAAEAPLSSENGELILAEARKIAPEKPVKYFIFGHHHPHYLGGMRPFVHQNATILCVESNLPYVEYLVNSPHTLQPDRLQIEPKKLKTALISDKKIISDGDFEMQIHFIGDQSAHTNDYLIYYFPKEKLVFEDDLVWISTKGNLEKAGKRQAGLYNAIKKLNLEVENVLQSWPSTNFEVKTLIPWIELEKTAKM